MRFFTHKRRFSTLSEQEIIALAISSEEEDSRIFRSFAAYLRAAYPASAAVFDGMASEEDSHRHLSLIRADEITDVHHQLLRELRKAYNTSERVDVTVHRIEPVTTNTDALYFEGIYAP